MRSRSSDGGAITFRHALLREAVYDDLLPSERAELHMTFARVLTASVGAGSASTLRTARADHWAASLHLIDPAAQRLGHRSRETVAIHAYAKLNGVPVAVVMTVTVNFTLR